MTIDKTKAAQYFTDWKRICDADNGALWGIDLHTPFMFIDNERNVVANCADAEGNLTADGDVFVGNFPADMAFAATAVDLWGKRWGTMPWFLTELEGGKSAVETMIHEGFHAVQPTLFGKNGFSPQNGHLNNPDARIFVLCEMRAMFAAFKNSGEARQKAIEAALRFRAERMSIYDKRADEASNEIMEGTAVFTDMTLGKPSREAILESLEQIVKQAGNIEQLAHMSGYFLGALYCFVIDALDPLAKRDFRCDTIMSDVLQELAAVAVIPAFTDIDADAYDHAEVTAHVQEQEKARAAVFAGFVDKFTNKPTLSLVSEEGGSIRGQIIPVEGLGTVLKGRYECFGSFGRLIAEDGEVLSVQKGHYKVTAVDMRREGDKLIGEDWEIELADGWGFVADGVNWKLSK